MKKAVHLSLHCWKESHTFEYYFLRTPKKLKAMISKISALFLTNGIQTSKEKSTGQCPRIIQEDLDL